MEIWMLVNFGGIGSKKRKESKSEVKDNKQVQAGRNKRMHSKKDGKIHKAACMCELRRQTSRGCTLRMHAGKYILLINSISWVIATIYLYLCVHRTMHMYDTQFINQSLFIMGIDF
jgi:hypothetical protein